MTLDGALAVAAVKKTCLQLSTRSHKHVYKRKGESYSLLMQKFINSMCGATPFGNCPHH